MILYKIYRIPDFIHQDGSKGKIGVTYRNVQQRIRENKRQSKGPFEFWEVLEVHTDKATASRRELELQEEFGYIKDNSNYTQISEAHDIEACRRNGKKISKQELSRRGKKGYQKGLGKLSFEERSEIGKHSITFQSIEAKRKGGRTTIKMINEKGLGIHKGEKNPASKITESMAIKIYDEYVSTDNYYGKISVMARKYNVSRYIVKRIGTKKTWKHIHD